MMNKIKTWCRGVVKGFLDNQCSMHAAGLTYFSMLAMMPILCCILVVAKAVGVDDYARNHINARIDALITNIEKGQDDELAAAAGAFSSEEDVQKKRIAAEEFATQARTISNALFERIDAFDVATFGWIGFGLLLWTVISSLGMVEMSFNRIWGVPKPRPVWKRAWVYLLVMIVMPVLAAVAMSFPIMGAVKSVITATTGVTDYTKWVGDTLLWLIDSWAVKFAIAFVTATLNFAFIFWFMPNCRVPFRAAVRGGAATAILFGGWMKVCAVAQVGIAKSSALYGSFAFMPIVLAWLYMSWQIVLLGANMVREFARSSEEAAGK